MSEAAALLVRLLAEPGKWSAIADEVEESGTASVMARAHLTGQQALFNETTEFDTRLAEAENLLLEWRHEGMRFASLLDNEYPRQLLTIHQRPPFVMWRGEPNGADASGVCIVGSRAASPRGLATARELAHGLASRGVPVISGLAAGIDTAAHLGALDAGGRTVAVIGTGLRRAYPANNAELQDRVASEGMVLSQFLPDAPPTKYSFPMRNAIMSGYGAATVVVEASWKSGAKMQARLALEHGRMVLLMSSLLEHDWAREYAVRPGAHVVSSIDEIMECLQSLEVGSALLSWS